MIATLCGPAAARIFSGIACEHRRGPPRSSARASGEVESARPRRGSGRAGRRPRRRRAGPRRTIPRGSPSRSDRTAARCPRRRGAPTSSVSALARNAPRSSPAPGTGRGRRPRTGRSARRAASSFEPRTAPAKPEAMPKELNEAPVLVPPIIETISRSGIRQPRQPVDRALQRHAPGDADPLPLPRPAGSPPYSRQRRPGRHVVVVGVAPGGRDQRLAGCRAVLQHLLQLDPRQERRLELHLDHPERLRLLDGLVDPQPGGARGRRRPAAWVISLT